jgi:cell division protein FtsI (penicillin-binding protein 3)
MSRLLSRLDKSVPKRFRGFGPRMGFVVTLLAVAGLVLAGRAIDLQMVQHDRLAALAQRQSQRTIRLDGRRGPIYDRFGDPLAMSVKTDSLYAHPNAIEQPTLAAFRLARLLELDAETLERRLRSGHAFVWIKRHVTPAESAAAQALGLAGLGVTQEYARVYPARSFAGPLLGFTGVDTQGLEGLEYAYDSYLKGAEGYQVIDRDALGRTVLTGNDAFPTRGGSLRLTIHPAVQYIVEEELRRAVELHEAALGVALVLASRTGEILAMAHAPDFNPNDYLAFDKETYFNRAVTSGYEPGSTLKVVTAAVALEEGLVQPDTLFFCEKGEWNHYDSVIHDTQPHGWLGLDGIIRVSSNICAAKMGLLVPSGVFHAYLRKFGFGERLGLFRSAAGDRLAGEAEGYLPPLEKWTPVDHAALSFGHGILVSPLQLVTAVNAIANEGRRVQPRLVLEVRDPEGRIVEQNRTPVTRRVLSARTARTVRELMKAVVSAEGTGPHAAVPGFVVAGKTGTTEVYDIEARGYSKTKHIASFVGFVPADDPAVTILVMVERPRKGRYGGVVAAPVFSRIARRALPLLGLWPPEGVRRAGVELAQQSRPGRAH